MSAFLTETEERHKKVEASWLAMERQLKAAEIKVKDAERKLARDKKMEDLMAQSLGAVLQAEQGISRPQTPKYGI